MSKEDYESRFISFDEFELRVDEGDDGMTLHGTAPPYGKFSGLIGGRFIERFEAGAFKDGGDIIATQEHDDALLLGRTASGTLKIRDDAEGRHFSVKLPDTQAGRDVAALAKRGDLRGASFEFKVERNGDEWDTDKVPHERTIKKGMATMRQIGPVARPAYPQFGLAMRSLEAWEAERKPEAPERSMSEELERRLQDMELSATLSSEPAE